LNLKSSSHVLTTDKGDATFSNTGATARAAQASCSVAFEGRQTDTNRYHDGAELSGLRAAINRFESGGWTNVLPAARDRIKGDGSVLSDAEEEAITDNG